MHQKVGGQVVVDQLVDDFYHIMATDPNARDCYQTHLGKDLTDSAHKLKLFLSGWLGGPQLYLEKFGHPRLRMKHFPFGIGPKEVEQWLYCMKEALKKSPIDPGIQAQLLEAFRGVTEVIKNRD